MPKFLFIEATVDQLYTGANDNFKDKIDRETFEKLIRFDPTFKDEKYVGKYARWIIWLYIKTNDKKLLGEDSYKITQYLKKFNKVKDKLPIEKRDIMKYNSLPELAKEIDKFEEENPEVPTEKDIKAKVMKKKYNGATLIVIPKTDDTNENKDLMDDLFKASCLYGAGTKWCTTYHGGRYFKDYITQGNLYIIIFDNGEKYQFNFETFSFMNALDDPISGNYESWDKLLTFIETKLPDELGEYFLHDKEIFNKALIGFRKSERSHVIEYFGSMGDNANSDWYGDYDDPRTIDYIDIDSSRMFDDFEEEELNNLDDFEALLKAIDGENLSEYFYENEYEYAEVHYENILLSDYVEYWIKRGYKFKIYNAHKNIILYDDAKPEDFEELFGDLDDETVEDYGHMMYPSDDMNNEDKAHVSEIEKDGLFIQPYKDNTKGLFDSKKIYKLAIECVNNDMYEEALKVLNEELDRTLNRNYLNNVKVLKNPSIEEVEENIDSWREENSVRGLFNTVTNNIYIWNIGKACHMDILKAYEDEFQEESKEIVADNILFFRVESRILICDEKEEIDIIYKQPIIRDMDIIDAKTIYESYVEESELC